MVGEAVTSTRTAATAAGAALTTTAVDWLGVASKSITLVAGVLGIVLTVMLIRERWYKGKLAKMEVEEHDILSGQIKTIKNTPPRVN